MKEKVKNTNEEYYLYGLPVRDAMKNEYYCREINPADVRNAVKEDPTRCIKALHLKRQEGIKEELGVIVLRSRVLMQHRGDVFWTRYTDGARVQKQFDDEGKRADIDEMFVLKAPHGMNSHTERRTVPKYPIVPRRSYRNAEMPNFSRLATLKSRIRKHRHETDAD